jgi:hypothetical protein
MRVVITEDIIRNALNESIDEFIINEGFGDAVKGAWGYAKKAGNWLKNAAAEYMNYKTNGQWNKKYGIYPSYNVNQFSELRYLAQWFNIQKQTIESLSNPQNPSQISRDSTKINRYEGRPSDFIARECTYQNFTNWAGQYIKNYNGLKFIDQYIYQYITSNYRNPQEAIKAMDLGTFLETEINGQTYQQAASDNNKRKTTTQKQELQKEISDVYNFFKQVNASIGNVISRNVNDLPYFMKYNFNNYFNQYFKLYLSSGDDSVKQRLRLVRDYVEKQWYQWSSTVKSDPSKANMFKDWIDYNQFFNNQEGQQYWYLQRQTGAYGNKNKY